MTVWYKISREMVIESLFTSVMRSMHDVYATENFAVIYALH